MSLLLRACAVLAWSSLVVALADCDGALSGVPDPDGGPDENGELFDCTGLDAGVDAGCAPADAVDPCAALVSSTCGASCAESPACAAAHLLQQYEPGSCEAALGDPLTYPTCVASSCEGLVEKACGAATPLPACVDEPGCTLAAQLLARATDGASTQDEIAEAQQACSDGLADEIVFPPCS